ncbi:hypothetical protein HNR68_002886 [Saccharopolyspora hordei]|uniref:Uncharacterized protein n=1 Tax=Saccharopolyspora hordei TaxID=1838 RepID=A0A853AKD5_9PSEU|nr:hypothetical protein [Saccharopolyspora hordei]
MDRDWVPATTPVALRVGDRDPQWTPVAAGYSKKR